MQPAKPFGPSPCKQKHPRVHSRGLRPQGAGEHREQQWEEGGAESTGTVALRQRERIKLPVFSKPQFLHPHSGDKTGMFLAELLTAPRTVRQRAQPPWYGEAAWFYLKKFPASQINVNNTQMCHRNVFTKCQARLLHSNVTDPVLVFPGCPLGTRRHWRFKL